MRKVLSSPWIKAALIVGVWLTQSGCDLFEIYACVLAGGYWGEQTEIRTIFLPGPNGTFVAQYVEVGTGNFGCFPRGTGPAPSCAISAGAACVTDRPSKP